MPSYLSLLKWTDQGIRDAKNAGERLDAAKESITSAGGRLIFYYLLIGDYDVATLVEFPDDETAARVLLSLGAGGNIRSTSSRAFTEEEARGIYESL